MKAASLMAGLAAACATLVSCGSGVPKCSDPGIVDEVKQFFMRELRADGVTDVVVAIKNVTTMQTTAHYGVCEAEVDYSYVYHMGDQVTPGKFVYDRFEYRAMATDEGHMRITAEKPDRAHARSVE